MAHLAHYREAHPLPFVITHWINLVAMILLIFTGFYIHYPFFWGFESMARGIHVFFGFVLFINCIARLIMAFIVKSSPTGGTRKQVTDYKTWLPQKDNLHQGPQWIKYYLFFYTGCALWVPTADLPLFAAGTNLVGGLMSMRIIHYFMMFVFICFMFIHVYLANVEGIAPSLLMFFHKEHGGLVYDPDLHNIIGEDDLGHGEKH